MEENTQLSQEEVNEIIKDFPIEPRYNKVIVTLNIYEEDGLVLEEEGISEVQYIVATGSRSEYSPGDKVLLDLRKLMVKVPSPTDSTQVIQQIEVDPINVDDRVYAFVDESCIKAKDNR